MEQYDVIVLGTGGVGSAALYQLASRGLRVLGLDQYPPAHHYGSSHGQTRIIRQAYFEHSDYVPLLRRTYTLWHDIESQSSQQLFHQVGLLEVGPGDGVVVPGVLQAADRHGLPVESLTPAQAVTRFPHFRIPPDLHVVYEPTAGYLLVEKCVAAHLSLARQAGAEWRQERVVDWNIKADGVVVRTDQARFSSQKLVITAGAWANQLLGDLGIPLRIVAKHQYWFNQTTSSSDSQPPTFFFELPSGYFYGFPSISEKGVKVARHSGGTEWTEPRSLEIQDDDDRHLVTQFIDSFTTTIETQLLDQQACMYTLSPDEHFIIDFHPSSQDVVFVAGLSGHGFKFAPVLAEAVSELVLSGDCSLPIGFLKLDRFFV